MFMSHNELNERSRRVLWNLVSRYIREGQPIGSKLLSQEPGIAVSSATVRNVMSDLEELGYIVSPHTSAGRVPTIQGYRFFVDAFLTSKIKAGVPLGGAFDDIRAELNPERSPTELIDSTSKILSSLTHQAGVVSLPKRDVVTLRQIEFLPLSGERILAIMVLNDSEVQNRVVQTPQALSEIELKHAANFINQQFAGESLSDIRQQFIRLLDEDQARYDEALKTAALVASQVLDGDADEQYVVAGEANLIQVGNEVNIERLKELLEALQGKRDIFDLMERCLAADGVQIYIGEESGYQVLDDYSVVSAPYHSGGKRVGVLGVIGPTRMAYDQVITMVEVTSRLLGLALDNQ